MPDSKIKQVSEKHGVPFREIKLGMAAMDTEDPELGALYSLADNLAIYIPEGRHEWNIRRALHNYVKE